MNAAQLHSSFQDVDAEILLPTHCCQGVIPPYPPLQLHPFPISSHICCTCLLSQSIFTHPLPHLSFSLGRLVLTFSWPLVPVFPRPLLPSSSKLSLCLSHVLLNFCKDISSYSPKTLPKLNSPLWCLQNPRQFLFWLWSFTLIRVFLSLPYTPVSFLHCT